MVRALARRTGRHLIIAPPAVPLGEIGAPLVASSPALRTAPKVLDVADPRRVVSEARDFGGPHPGLAWIELEDATVEPEADGVLMDSRLVVPITQWLRYPAISLGGAMPGFRQQLRRGAVARVDPHPVRIDEGIFLGGCASGNYYHWLVEVLPRLTAARGLPPGYEDLPLLVPHFDPGSSLEAALLVLAGERRLIRLEARRLHRVGRLVLIDGQAARLGSDDSNPPAPGSHAIHGALMQEHRHLLLDGLGLSASANRPVDPGEGRRIFLTRPVDGRRTYNQSEVEAALEPLGFESIDPSTLPFPEQARLFQDAAVICGPSGAALTNLLFVRPGSRVLTWWFFPAVGQMAFWSNLAALSGADVTILPVAGGMGLSADRLPWLPGYRIDPDFVVSAVTGLLPAGGRELDPD